MFDWVLNTATQNTSKYQKQGQQFEKEQKLRLKKYMLLQSGGRKLLVKLKLLTSFVLASMNS